MCFAHSQIITAARLREIIRRKIADEVFQIFDIIPASPILCQGKPMTSVENCAELI